MIHDEDNPKRILEVKKGTEVDNSPRWFEGWSLYCSPTTVAIDLPLEINSGPPTVPVSGQEDDPVEQLHPSTSQEQADHPRPKRESATLKGRQLIK